MVTTPIHTEQLQTKHCALQNPFPVPRRIWESTQCGTSQANTSVSNRILSFKKDDYREIYSLADNFHFFYCLIHCFTIHFCQPYVCIICFSSSSTRRPPSQFVLHHSQLSHCLKKIYLITFYMVAFYCIIFAHVIRCCCLPTPMTLASGGGGGSDLPACGHKPASPSI